MPLSTTKWTIRDQDTATALKSYGGAKEAGFGTSRRLDVAVRLRSYKRDVWFNSNLIVFFRSFVEPRPSVIFAYSRCRHCWCRSYIHHHPCVSYILLCRPLPHSPVSTDQRACTCRRYLKWFAGSVNWQTSRTMLWSSTNSTCWHTSTARLLVSEVDVSWHWSRDPRCLNWASSPKADQHAQLTRMVLATILRSEWLLSVFLSLASISKRISEVPEMQLSAAADYATAYKVRYPSWWVFFTVLIFDKRNTPSTAKCLC